MLHLLRQSVWPEVRAGQKQASVPILFFFAIGLQKGITGELGLGPASDPYF